eukprot:TRINITY_DN298_c0_g1_i1.p1 TRINITY_DN298_c0_g1~~TRINITY_DN298_c0_g1_i1.p1  ORF type:complete len:284 (-),score=87.04 TRINITY_DN298_c0_g1_i1:332-1183(-)
MIRRPPRSTLSSSSAASDVYKRQGINAEYGTHQQEAMMNGGDESVYCLIPPKVEPPPKNPLYRSKYPGTVAGTKRHSATMGPLKVTAPNPNTFLKSYTRPDNKLPEPNKFQYTDSHYKKPQVPRRADQPVHGLVTSKNFITCNAVENILAVPKKTESRQMSYVNKKGYGKVPAYLEKVKAEIQDEYTYIQEMQEAYQEDDGQGGHARTRMLGADEAAAMRDGLKTNWDRINKAYQTLSFTLDTPAKKQRKEEFEAQLEQIERDIEKLSKGSLFVEDEHEDYGY